MRSLCSQWRVGGHALPGLLCARARRRASCCCMRAVGSQLQCTGGGGPSECSQVFQSPSDECRCATSHLVTFENHAIRSARIQGTSGRIPAVMASTPLNITSRHGCGTCRRVLHQDCLHSRHSSQGAAGWCAQELHQRRASMSPCGVHVGGTSRWLLWCSLLMTASPLCLGCCKPVWQQGGSASRT